MKVPLLASLLVAAALAGQAQPLVIHEWGTFTSLQDEDGQTIGGINTDDEPVPSFCHDQEPGLINRADEPEGFRNKGIPRCHPDVTMRLETPVLYFHLPKGTTAPVTASVKVTFHGGWLTQFYPAAEASSFSRFARLTNGSSSTLAWNDLKIGVEAKGPATTERVWTAPRAVEAAAVSATNHESEQFLFYRGAGHLLSPLQVSRSVDEKTLLARAQVDPQMKGCGPMRVEHLWLASFRADGTAAFRSLPAVTLASPAPGDTPEVLFSTAADFGPKAYSKTNLNDLRQQMRQALEAEGLFQDEADALLNTWEVSYFKSPGLRLFFMVPRVWTDACLPLEVSVPCQVRRAMVGRLELVTPDQRARLQALAQGPVPKKPWAHWETRNGRTEVAGNVPPIYRDLGRFRNALLLDAYNHHSTPSLQAFIQLNGLHSRFPQPSVGYSPALGQAN